MAGCLAARSHAGSLLGSDAETQLVPGYKHSIIMPTPQGPIRGQKGGLLPNVHPLPTQSAGRHQLQKTPFPIRSQDSPTGHRHRIGGG